MVSGLVACTGSEASSNRPSVAPFARFCERNNATGELTTIAMLVHDDATAANDRPRIAGLRLGKVTVPTHVDTAQVEAVLDARLDAMTGCFGRAKVDDPKLRGELRVRADVDRDGAITKPVVDGVIATQQLQRCVGAKMKQMVLPGHAKGYALSLTIAFEP